MSPFLPPKWGHHSFHPIHHPHGFQVAPARRHSNPQESSGVVPGRVVPVEVGKYIYISRYLQGFIYIYTYTSQGGLLFGISEPKTVTVVSYKMGRDHSPLINGEKKLQLLIDCPHFLGWYNGTTPFITGKTPIFHQKLNGTLPMDP